MLSGLRPPSASHVKRQASLRSQVVPSILYKYTTHATAGAIIESGRLRWSSPNLFNDLAEFQRMPRFEPSLTEATSKLPTILVEAATGQRTLDHDRLSPQTQLLIQLVQMLLQAGITASDIIESLQNDQPDADQKMDEMLRAHMASLYLARARVLCLTSDPENEVMWGTYADSHAGCALGFTHIPELSTPLQEARQVQYTEQAPVVGSGIDFLLYGDTSELRARTHQAICYTKKVPWSYEKEWRVVTWRWEERDSDVGHYKFYPKELVSVTFGARASADGISQIRRLLGANYPHVTLFRIVQKGEHLQRIKDDA